MAVVSLKDVHKSYPLGKERIEAVRGVSFDIEKGEFAAVSGPSGSGKSTILNMIGLIDLPSDGSIIIGGTSDFMNRLAFGEQIVDLRKGADNSHLRRLKSIEDFYIDVYNQVGREYGKDNIVSFIVHCDETGVHAHCTVVPTGIVKKKERVSWKSVFGRTKTESSKKFTEIHDRFYNEVGKKYGLERGLPISKTGARHKSKAEYQKELSDGLAKMEKAVKGLTSMVENACGRLGIAGLEQNLEDGDEGGKRKDVEQCRQDVEHH